MDQFHYQVSEPNEDYRQAKIIKSGITATFTIAEVEAHEETLRTFKKEREAELTVERAKLENIRSFHPIVDTLTPVQLTAIALFKEGSTVVEKTEAKLKDVDAALAEYAAEKAQMMSVLGFVATAITPNPDEHGQTPSDPQKE